MSRRKNCSAGHYPLARAKRGKKKRTKRFIPSEGEKLVANTNFPRIPRNLHIEFPAWRADLHNLYAFSHPFRGNWPLFDSAISKPRSDLTRAGKKTSRFNSWIVPQMLLQLFNCPILNLWMVFHRFDLIICNWNFLTFLFFGKLFKIW